MPEPENLVLRHLQGLRREMAALLEERARDRDLIIRLSAHMDDGFDAVRQSFDGVRKNFDELRRDLREVKSDITLLENRLISRHSEVLTILRRLDAIGVPPDDEFGAGESPRVQG